ncbi:MarR family winged helix-turn-helix transcriptional regulator [Streptacidiphilus fuscans]|uniref:MarR family transcriptional regulator n=1 Tax=Streptacidiphilus fuscans TaxID=2789292 RepID=A0A931B6N4_9ACTN|nr:MarR family transcriptional regulator [Streptacidiphilus fuscans]MBF9068828.1 MarR family transcriptional regulator [Streptacidiphilus fuscans]
MATDVGPEIADALGVLLQRGTRAQLHRRLTEGLDDALDEVTYPVLSGLARTGPCSAADLAGRIGLDRSGVTRRADRLEVAGLLRREPDPADRRATLLALTEAGERTIRATRERLAEHIERSLADWPPGEAETFARALRRFVAEGPFADS